MAKTYSDVRDPCVHICNRLCYSHSVDAYEVRLAIMIPYVSIDQVKYV